jgi:hypothetical protein
LHEQEMLKYHRKLSELIDFNKLNFNYIGESINWHFNNIKRKIIIGDKIISYGKKNKDKKFYVVGRELNKTGLFSIVTANLSHIIFALRHKFIPVIDMRNYHNIYLKDGALFKENSWEYYFEQPLGYSMEDIKSSKCIHLAQSYRSPDYNDIVRNEILNENNNKLFFFFKEQFRKYIIFNEYTLRYLDEDYANIISDKEDVLGVLCRGTDYLLSKPHGHPIQPEPLQVLKKARETLEAYKCAYIYLSTEDQKIYELFKSNFGNILLTNNQYRYNSDEIKGGQWLADVKSERADNNYHLGFEYLSSLHILSKCKCFIGGLNTGTLGAFFMTKGFDYHYVWNLGKYP